MAEKNGAFGEKFARRRTWKMDENLQRAIEHLVQEFDPLRIADIGAGGGEYVRWLKGVWGVASVGFDATKNIYDISGGDVHEVDFSAPGAGAEVSNYYGKMPIDLAICIEVGEHIPEECLPTFIENVAAVSGKLLMSWATPGQRGRDHVSCREPQWVAERFDDHGLFLNVDATEAIRKLAGKGWDKKLLFMTRDD
jgi:cyclopropane fatty-acyl-phospholipid synthase-like methyltransferase